MARWLKAIPLSLLFCVTPKWSALDAGRSCYAQRLACSDSLFGQLQPQVIDQPRVPLEEMSSLKFV